MKDEERKEIKEELKKRIDEMTDEELDQVAGGGCISDNLEGLGNSLKILALCGKIISNGVCPLCGEKVSTSGNTWDNEAQKIAQQHLKECSNK